MYEMILVLNPEKIIFDVTEDSELSEFVSEKDRIFPRSKTKVELIIETHDHTNSKTVCVPYRSFDDAVWYISVRYHLLYRAHTELCEAREAHVIKNDSNINLHEGIADIVLSNGKRYHWEIKVSNL